MTKILNLKRTCLGHLELVFGIYLGFGNWNLSFTVDMRGLR